MCDWFIACNNRPDGTVTHPVLGEVPTCARCAAKLGLGLDYNEFEPRPGQVWVDVDYRQYRYSQCKCQSVFTDHRCDPLVPRFLYIKAIGEDGSVWAVSQFGVATVARKFRALPRNSRATQGFKLILDAPL